VNWVKNYDRSWLGADVVAGLTTRGDRHSQGDGVRHDRGDCRLQVGLLHRIPADGGVCSTRHHSRVLSVSTTTTIAILGATALGAAMQAHPGLSATSATATLAILVGAILLLARLLRLGFLANFISEPVLVGFKAGIGLVIVVDQLPKLLGLHIHKEGFFRDLVSIAAHAPETSIPTLLVALGTFAAIVVFEKWVPRAPAPLVAVAGGIAASAFLGSRRAA
jgi:MFS superfamily sulfate permease-like transporter